MIWGENPLFWEAPIFLGWHGWCGSPETPRLCRYLNDRKAITNNDIIDAGHVKNQCKNNDDRCNMWNTGDTVDGRNPANIC